MRYKPIKCSACSETVGFYQPEGSLFDAELMCPSCMHHLHTIMTEVLPDDMRRSFKGEEPAAYNSFEIGAELMRSANNPNAKMTNFNSPYMGKLRDHLKGLLK